MEMTSLNRLIRSPSILSMVAVLTRATLGIILLPFILKIYEVGDINVWFLFTNIMIIQNALDAGFAPTISRYFAYAVGGNKNRIIPSKEENSQVLISQLFGTIRKVYHYLSLAIFILLLSIGSYLLYEPINSSENPNSNFIAWGILLIVSLIYIRGNTYSALLLGTNKVGQLKSIEIFTNLLSFIISLVILLLNLPIALLLINQQLWYGLRILLNKFLCKRYYEYLWIDDKYEFNKILFRSILSKSWKSGIGVLFASGVLQFSGIIYANIGKEYDVSRYLFSLRILALISQLSQAPFYSKLPLMQTYYSQARIDKFLKLIKQRISISIWLFFIVAICFQYLGEPILKLIGSNIDFPGKLYLSIFILAFAIERVGAMYIQMYTVTNIIIWHISNLIAGILFITISVLVYNWLNYYALPVAFLFSNMIFYAPFNVFHSVKEFNLNFIRIELWSSIAVIILLVFNLIIHF